MKKFQDLDLWIQNHTKVQDLKGIYKPLVTTDKYGNIRFRAKVATIGMRAAKFWDTERNPIPYNNELDLKGASVTPVIEFTCIWNSGGMWGVCVELRHAVVSCIQNVCPI